MCILFVYTLLKVVNYCDLSVLSRSVMGLKKNWMGVRGVRSIHVFFWIIGFFFNFAKPLILESLSVSVVVR